MYKQTIYLTKCPAQRWPCQKSSAQVGGAFRSEEQNEKEREEGIPLNYLLRSSPHVRVNVWLGPNESFPAAFLSRSLLATLVWWSQECSFFIDNRREQRKKREHHDCWCWFWDWADVTSFVSAAKDVPEALKPIKQTTRVLSFAPVRFVLVRFVPASHFELLWTNLINSLANLVWLKETDRGQTEMITLPCCQHHPLVETVYCPV